MLTHFRADQEGNSLLYPGRKVNSRGLFPYEYEVYDAKYDRIDNLYDGKLMDEKESARLTEYIDSFPEYDHEKLVSALRSMIEKNDGKKVNFTLLLDNSGSMRWGPIKHATQLVIAFGKACDELGIPLEILWNTTTAWKWWKVREDG